MNNTPEKRLEAWKRLTEDVAKWTLVIGLKSITKVRTGTEVEFVFELADKSFSVPLELVMTQATFRKRVYSETGYAIPTHTGGSWDETCMLFYITAGEEQVLDKKNDAVLDLVQEFLDRNTQATPAEDYASEQALLEQVRAGTLKAFRNQDGQWVFKLSEVMGHANRHGAPIKRAEVVRALHDFGFGQGRDKALRYWTSPVNWGMGEEVVSP